MLAVANSTESLLVFAGWAFVVVPIMLIVVPYWRGKADLVTAWSFALLGCSIFMGIAALEAVDPPARVFENYISFEFPDSYYKATLLRNVFFFGCLLLFYYAMPIGKKFASRRFTRSAPWSSMLFGVLLVLCTATVVTAFVAIEGNIPVLREVFFNLGHKAATFGVAFAFYSWYRNRTSPVALIVFAVVLAAAAVYAMRTSSGRRLLLCIAAAPIVVMYWTNWRYRSSARVMLVGALATSVVVIVALWYQCFRFFDRGQLGQERTLANTVAAMKQVTLADVAAQLDSWKPKLAQGVFLYAMVTKRLVEDQGLDVRPLNTLQFALTYAIPRRFWPEKPQPFGAIIVTDVLKLPQKTNWGLGVAGQAYYEGDWYALPVYAIVLVLLVRLIDEPIKREPNNPYFIATVASSMMFVITWLRGDLGVHTVEVVECLVFLWVIQRLSAQAGGSRVGAYAADFGNAFSQRLLRNPRTA
ncbi:MAG: hypothetical protein KF688_12220 [Pirellulales bacterium]|nr:hypothetical protein [Pirellulales bacterium]MBX3432178.1 hypothetical protein [Pirellulales bacterium]